MLPDRVSNPGPLTYESGALPIVLRGPAEFEPAMVNESSVFEPLKFYCMFAQRNNYRNHLTFTIRLHFLSRRVEKMQQSNTFQRRLVTTIKSVINSRNYPFNGPYKLVPLLSTPCGTTGKDYCYDGCHWIMY